VPARRQLRTLLRRYRERDGEYAARGSGPRQPLVDVRITAALLDRVRAHVEDVTHGEEAGFLLCSVSRLDHLDVLLVRDWVPVPETALVRNTAGSVLSWSAQFNSSVLERAIAMGASPVLVHSHGVPHPAFSGDDRVNERRLFGAVSRLMSPAPAGTLLLGDGTAAGSFWLAGHNDLGFRRLVILGDTIEIWPSAARQASHTRPRPRARLARQSAAIGPRSDALLASAQVAVVGISGGGSHVVQQLIYQGIGTLIAVDDQLIDSTNLGRVVAAIEADIDTTPKTRLALRTAAAVDPSIIVTEIGDRFPSAAAISAMRCADVIVACVDTFQAREAINAFCRRYMIPLLDIGIAIRSAGERLATADGQLIASLPGKPCLRCWFITDSILAAERRDHPPGYDRNPNAPAGPQVVSMNGTLASEACNSALDLITGYSGGRRGARIWQYDCRVGTLTAVDVPSARPDCPACAEEGFGDPPHALSAPAEPGLERTPRRRSRQRYFAREPGAERMTPE
jgi:molybdopterin/thiamine biosynthesis adenylyltransferase